MDYGKDLKDSEGFRNMLIFAALVLAAVSLVLVYFGYLEPVLQALAGLLVGFIKILFFVAVLIIVFIIWLEKPAWVT